MTSSTGMNQHKKYTSIHQADIEARIAILVSLNYTYLEIAELLSIKPNTVKSLMQRCGIQNDYYNMTYDEIAKETGLTKRQVQLACTSGLKKMLKTIQDDEYILHYFLDCLADF